MNPQVSEIIRHSVITADSVTLPGQLDRALYLEVNKVLADAGGKWDRKAKTHLFARNPREALQKFLDTGESVNLKKELQAFYSPPAVAERVVELARVEGCKVLEPSAGAGALVMECLRQNARQVTAIELDTGCREALLQFHKTVAYIGEDFLECTASNIFERVVMNPPFARNAWKKHLFHALSRFLADGGILACVVPDVKEQINNLLEPLGIHYKIFPLPAGSFKASGTLWPTAVVVVNK
jgi:hypothetical protein